MILHVSEVVKLLDQGEVVAIPTDTVYGLAVEYKNKEAVHRLFSLKGRSVGNPFVILLSKDEDIYPFLKEKPRRLAQMMSAFWPGALTIVLSVNPVAVPEYVRAWLPTTGFRVPCHEATRELIRVTGPIAVTSANHSKQPPAMTAEEVENYFGDGFPVVSNQEPYSGEASTVVCYDKGKWVVSRSGKISQRDVDAVMR